MAEGRTVQYLDFNLINTITVVIMALAAVAVLSGVSILVNRAKAPPAAKPANGVA